MTGFTDTVEAEILDGIFTGWAGYANLFLALSTTTPNDDGTNFTEATGTGYARVQTVNANWAAAVTGAPTTRANGAEIAFPTAGGDWSAGANFVSFGLFDAVTVGSLIVVGVITTPKPVLSADTARFPIGDLVIRLGDPNDFP